MQVSGLKYDLDISKKADCELDDELNLIRVNSINRVSNVQILNGDKYEPIDLEKTYTVGSISYILLNGGCGLNCIFENKEPLLTDVATDFETLIDYINSLDGDLSCYADFEGRINIRKQGVDLYTSGHVDVKAIKTCQSRRNIVLYDRVSVCRGGILSGSTRHQTSELTACGDCVPFEQPKSRCQNKN